MYALMVGILCVGLVTLFDSILCFTLFYSIHFMIAMMLLFYNMRKTKTQFTNYRV